MKTAVVLLGLVLAVMAWPQAPAPTGKELFEKRCGGCHSLDTDKEGPRLRSVYGRAAAASSFPYSDALKKSQLTWDDQTLNRWLADSEKLVPGADMTIRVDKPAEREAIIAYLKEAR
ncbi:MAG TPA: c-type cytochrome [Bryobacteraceae bacterium]|nr:c-type cytochrome [Bryobacteraceae bacterium]